ncbi:MULTISPECIES: hypothetical protein [Halorussus]|uniref:hypothetical protein n=1 Tax=Halorussus TaxID=1070314 RepID=UPI0020A1F663|nr:hypothetical protein [Halorussus vallis]USZ74031.1 hypothetical protein NGM07_11245 [Halorussus vallis]
MTVRDDAWHAVLVALSNLDDDEPLRLADLGFSDERKHTVRRTMNEMESKGWLQRPNNRSGDWYPGPMFNTICG